MSAEYFPILMPQQLSCLNRGAYTHSTTIFWTLDLRYDPNELQRENCSCLKWLSLAVCYLFKKSKTCPRINCIPKPMAEQHFYCPRGNRAKKRGFIGGRFITPHDAGKNSQILRNPLKLAFLTIFGCK